MRSQIFIDILETHHIRVSTDRLELLRIIIGHTPQLLSVETLSKWVAEKGLSISSSTIRNTLNLFTSNGLLELADSDIHTGKRGRRSKHYLVNAN